MQLVDLAKSIEEWAPSWTAWERDNVGIQVGRLQQPVSNVLVALDVTEKVVQEAVKKECDTIVSHHPLLFRQPKRISDGDEIGKLVLLLAEHKIGLFSAHTNLDSAKDGVNFALARNLGLEHVRFLTPLATSLAKIVVFVPEGYTEKVLDAMSAAGAGVVGEYASCSFRSAGKGSFRGSADAHPFIGKTGALELADEYRFEMICPRATVGSVIAAMKLAHPYEEVAYDIYNVENTNSNFGMGAVGDLKKSQTLKQFLSITKKALGAAGLRFTGSLPRHVRRVAVCGGSGSDLVGDAVRAGADVFVTADIRYHTFQSAEDRIALVDAGHYETEQVILRPLADRIRQAASTRGEAIKVEITKHITNPIQWM